MKINIVKLNVIDNDGVHLSKRAWQYSRNNDESSENDITGLNLPVNEIPSVILEIESTIIEREIIASMRDHNMWARSSRVDEPLEFKIPKVIEDYDDFNKFEIDSRAAMAEKKQVSRQDEYRMLMPAIALTKYTISINLRSLIILRNFFKKIYILENETPSFPKILSFGAFRNLENVIVKMTGSAAISRYPTINILPELMENTSGRLGGFITYSGTISFSLRSHLIRHRMLFMNDNLLEIINSKTFEGLSLSTPVKVNITSSVEFWKRIVSTRSCWLTHYKIWKEIVDIVSAYIGEAIEDVLPCGNGECPYAVDNEARIDNRDPNPPCPIYINQTEVFATTEHVAKMRTQLVEDKRPDFWNNLINEVEK